MHLVANGKQWMEKYLKAGKMQSRAKLSKTAQRGGQRHHSPGTSPRTVDHGQLPSLALRTALHFLRSLVSDQGRLRLPQRPV